MISGRGASLSLIASLTLALAYGGVSASGLLAQNQMLLAGLKASAVSTLALLALRGNMRTLAAALACGALGDALLAIEGGFVAGACSFLIGHLIYIALFLRAGVGLDGLRRAPVRLIGMMSLTGAALSVHGALVPANSALNIPLLVYTLTLIAMTTCSLTLPVRGWPAMTGAVLFLISDGFVAAELFHPLADPALAALRGFCGWMLYWAGQALLCWGGMRMGRSAAHLWDH